MKVLVTGATGFIGRHVVAALLAKGHSVIAVARNQVCADELSWPAAVRFLACNIHKADLDVAEFGEFDAVIHLAWPGLPNYQALYHIEETLPAEYRFLKALVMAGCKELLVAGTCLEYGMQNGCLHEEMVANPVTPYALAKDTLRHFLQVLRTTKPFTLKWARLFYMYGSGQNAKSLLSQLDSALERGDNEFPMSGGEQLRDYLPVEEVAARLVALLESRLAEGIVNICSAHPISVRRLVEEHLLLKKKSIALKLGRYPYPDYEPFAFWGCGDKFEGFKND